MAPLQSTSAAGRSANARLASSPQARHADRANAAEPSSPRRLGAPSAARGPARALCVVLGAFGVALFAACGDDAAPTVLQQADFQAPKGDAKFDHNNVLEPGALTDIETLKNVEVQRFLHRTPYERPSFLETYQSNGVRAGDAIANTAVKYRINPLVFLVFAEAVQGLVGERNYPFPPDRVEYVFRCGCLQENSCRPEFAGFDRQVECLGRAMRAAIDEIKSNKDQQTASGWGPETTSTTLDDVKVTPENESTAVLYDRTPRVNEGSVGGTWIFWNIWQLYASKLDYTGPVGSIDGRWIGEACAIDQACGIEKGICAQNYPGGLCTVACNGACPSQPSKAAAFCAKFSSGGFCLAICNPTQPNCRKGYKCVRVNGVKPDETENVCQPDPDAPKPK